MSTEYDSVKIRTLAQQISRTAGAVSDVNRESLQNVLKEMPENFRGSAATALQEAVGELMEDVKSVSAHLTGVSQALTELARRVDLADQQAKALIENR